MTHEEALEKATSLHETLLKHAHIGLAHALRRVQTDKIQYLLFAADCFRNGHDEAARGWALNAAECAKAEAVLTDVVAHPQPYRDLAARLAGQRRLDADEAVAAAAKQQRDRERRKHFAQQRERQA